jgi:GTPase
MQHKAGFVNLIGHPNVGKSTLMNLLIGEKLSIITPKAQTTRHRIMGIVNGNDYQIVFSDTPGIIKPHYKLHEGMMRFIDSALQDADIFLYMVEAGENVVEEAVIEKIRKSGKPLMWIINKIDLLKPEEVEAKVAFWEQKFPGAIVIPVSALHNANVDKVETAIIDNLPESPPYFPKDELTDKNVRFFVSEIIREKIFLFYRKEVPYSCEVVVEGYREDPDIHFINAVIYVERESQKAILLGHQGKAIKKVGIEARKDIEALVGMKVYLELTVKVSSDWRENELQLKRFGYDV